MSGRVTVSAGPAVVPRALATGVLLGLLGLLGVLGVLGVLATGWHVPAAAHASLVSSTPEDGERLDTLPGELTFTFSEQISAPAYAVLNSPDGDQVAAEDVEVDGDTVRVAVVDDPGAGTYTAAFRVVSADGHPVTGQLSFVVGGGDAESPSGTDAQDPPPTASADAPEAGDTAASDGEAAATTEDDGLLAPWQWGVGAGLLLLAGGLWLLSRRVRG